MSLNFPNIDPVALALGPLEIRWYALAYLAGFLLGWRYALFIVDQRKEKRPDRTDIDDFMSWAVLGVILGGRLGYVLFYQPALYLAQPLSIFKVWEGGMSFHGGVIGVIVALIVFSVLRKINVLRLSDIFCAAAPLGLFFGRIANFINGELYGRATSAPWGMVFPGAGAEPRHPSQLYESALEGALLFVALFFLITRPDIRRRPGLVTGAFLAGYGVIRLGVELFREPDIYLGLFWESVSMGQILSLPMIVAGALLALYAYRKGYDPAH